MHVPESDPRWGVGEGGAGNNRENWWNINIYYIIDNCIELC